MFIGSAASTSSYLQSPNSPGGSNIAPYGTHSPISYSPMTPGSSGSIASPYNPQTPGGGINMIIFCF